MLKKNSLYRKRLRNRGFILWLKLIAQTVSAYLAGNGRRAVVRDVNLPTLILFLD